MIAFVTVALSALALSAATPYHAVMSVLLDDKMPATVASMPIDVPVLAGDLTMRVLSLHETGFEVCMKPDVAAPAAAGTKSWTTAGYCSLWTFGNKTVSLDALAQQSAGLSGAGSAVQRSSAASLSRRSVRADGDNAAPAAGGWTQSMNVRGARYFVTVAPMKKLAHNTTVEFALSGETLDANLPKVYVDEPFQKTALPSALVRAQLSTPDKADAVGPHTASLTVMANVVGDKTAAKGTVFARWGAPPTVDAHDFALALPNAQNNSLVIAAPRVAAWYFGVLNENNATALAFNLTVSVKQCDDKSFGVDCKTAPVALAAPGAVKSADSVKKGDVRYYKFHRNVTMKASALLAAADPASLAVAVAATAAPDADVKDVKAPTVYARLGALPTPTDYDVSGCLVAKCSSYQQTLVVPEDDVAVELSDLEWYVMVQANSDGGLAVWNAAGGACAATCNKEGGACNKETAVCECKSEDFEMYDCSAVPGGLERWEWALVIGGAVLVAIGLIACIVYFIQKQNRRAGFERV